jgi:hypothetical protein
MKKNHGYDHQSKLPGIIPPAARDCEDRRQVDSTYQFRSATQTELEFHNNYHALPGKSNNPGVLSSGVVLKCTRC